MCQDCLVRTLTDLADVLCDQAHHSFMETRDPYERGRADAFALIIQAATDMQEEDTA